MRTSQQEIATPNATKNSIIGMRFGTTKWLTRTAAFTALALVTKFLGQALTLSGDFKITFIYIVWLIAAASLGPIGGGIVGALSDLLGAIIFPTGAINPLLTIGCTLYGVIAGLLFKYLPIKNVFVKFIICGTACTIFVTLLFDSFAIWFWCRYYLKLTSYVGKSFWVYVGASRMLQLLTGAINIAITTLISPMLIKTGILPSNDKKIKLLKE